MRKILKGATILLIAAAMLFSTAAVTAETEQQMNTDFIKNPNPGATIAGNNLQSLGTLYEQLPIPEDGNWIFRTSASGSGYRVHDDVPDIAQPICDLHWWGLSLLYDNGWYACDPTGMSFEIIFWDALLGTPLCVYQVTPTFTGTGEYFLGYEMYYWETDLDPCCDMTFGGWLSIQSISSPNGCWFLWAGSEDGDLYCYQEGSTTPDQISDCAYRLTDGEQEPIPAICCDPSGLNFGTDLVPGTTYTGQIYVTNCGEDGSLLDWHVDQAGAPSWATWTFTPSSGTGLPLGSVDTVTVTCTVPVRGTYSGIIKVINDDDSSDFCECSTGGTWKTTAKSAFVQNILQKFPMLNLLFKALF